MRKLLLLAALIAAAMAGAYVLSRPTPEKPATTPVAEPALKTSGVYADDWLALCGAQHGAEQERCTARLDAAYGRSVGAPAGK